MPGTGENEKNREARLETARQLDLALEEAMAALARARQLLQAGMAHSRVERAREQAETDPPAPRQESAIWPYNEHPDLH
jgi:hypothetical protein